LASKSQISKTSSSQNLAGDYLFDMAGADYYFQAYFSDPSTGYAGLEYWPMLLGGMFHHLGSVLQGRSAGGPALDPAFY